MTPAWEKVLDARLGALYVVQFEVFRRTVIDYAVVLVVDDAGAARTVRVFDGAHDVKELPATRDAVESNRRRCSAPVRLAKECETPSTSCARATKR